MLAFFIAVVATVAGKRWYSVGVVLGLLVVLIAAGVTHERWHVVGVVLRVVVASVFVWRALRSSQQGERGVVVIVVRCVFGLMQVD